MADPRQVGPQQRKANLSPLMEAKGLASQGEKVNFCPFGCELEDLDDQGYCKHVAGFTNDGVEMEPLVTVNGRRLVQVPLVTNEAGKQVPRYEKVRKTDKLVRITTSSRVYRETKDDKQPAAV